MPDWSPAQCLKFADERTRPARDLLAQVPLPSAGMIYDLGCGPGNSTALLVAAFPRAKVMGIDHSLAMIERARVDLPEADFIKQDLAFWSPPADSDLLYSNATLQWLPQHVALMQNWLMAMKPGAVLAVQMPDNLDEPSHRAMAELARQSSWAAKIATAATARAVIPSPATYYAVLKPHCTRLDIWHTIYNHPLDGPQAIVEWVKGTGLRPFIDPLDEAEREDYLAAYHALIVEAYPPDGTGMSLLRFPRLFIVATK